MNVLVIGGGGREHALAWKLAASEKVQRVYVAPGNGGTALDKRLTDVAITDPQALADFAAANKVGLTVVGPEAPLSQGVVDIFRARGLRIFCPTQAAAQLESSKAFAKDFMQRHGIPTAAYATFSDPAEAHAYINRLGAPIVVKADGLAAGKGVVVAASVDEAHEAVRFMLEDNALGVVHNAGGARVVIEEFLQGEEASFIVLCDGRNVLPLATSQDHKRVGDGDTGPNTGGMGAWSPLPFLEPGFAEAAAERFVVPTLAALRDRGVDYRGVLYAGFMVTPEGPKLLEYNVRFGDPDSQVVLLRMTSDLAALLAAAADGDLSTVPAPTFSADAAVLVVAASEGYPSAPRTGDVVEGWEAAAAVPGVTVLSAGVATDAQGRRVTAGGRVLNVVGRGPDVATARARAQAGVACLSWPGMHHRTDIAAG